MMWARLTRQRPFIAARRLLALVGLALVAVWGSAAPALADDRPDGSENATAGAMMVVIVCACLAAGIGFWWSWKNGEYAEPEEIKYQMLAMVEDETDYWEMDANDDEDEDDVAERPLLARPVAR